MTPLASARLLFFASGLAALVYQVMWMRGFGLVFGSTTRAASAVLAAFFLGMALGNHLGARWSHERGRAWLRYGALEIAIALGALGVLLWLDLYRAFQPELQRGLGEGTIRLTALQLLLALLAMGPPCVAMGATLPLLAQAVVEGTADLGRRTSGLYGANTLGAVAGVLLSGFLLPIWLGTRGTVQAAAALNVAIGLAAIALARSAATASSAEAAAAPARATRLDPLIVVVVVLSGFGTLALEVLYTRLLVNASDSSVYSFAIMLASFLVALALGSFVVAALVDRLASPWRLIGWSSFAASAAILVSPRVFVAAVADDAPRAGLGSLLAASAATIGPPAIAVAIALPTAWKLSIDEAARTGGRIGGLTAWNTLAAVAGSLIAGFVILPGIGLARGFVLVALLYAAMALLALWRGVAAPRRGVALLASCLPIAGLVLSGAWDVTPLRLRPQERLIHYHDGENGSVAVTRRSDGLMTLRINNRYGLGNSGTEAVRRQRAQGRLGPLLVPGARSVAFIGVATGISLSGVRDFPAIEEVLAIELVPGVLEAARLFEAHNQGILRDPRVRLLVADGRSHLQGSRERFDVIVGDLFVPWHAGTGYLYTREHFESVRRRLRGAGVFVQWILSEQIALFELQVLMATFADAFPEPLLCRVHGTGVLALVGTDGDARSLLAGDRLAGSEFECAPRLPLERLAQAPRNTDDRPLIEFSAARSRLTRSARQRAGVEGWVERLFATPSS